MHADDILLSQLADGELPNDECVRVLLDVLDDAAARDRLRGHLQLRQVTAAWRRQGVPRGTPAGSTAMPPGIPVTQAAPPAKDRSPMSAVSLIAAAAVGGILVLGGMFMSRWDEHAPPQANTSSNAVAAPHTVSPRQRRQMAQIFAFHESVAGPLLWYAADERNIRLAAVEAADPRAQPVAVVLRVASGGESPARARDYTIVCRDGLPATIPLPVGENGQPLRLFLSPTIERNCVGLKYSLVLEERGAAYPAALAGRRDVDLQMRPLGQFVLGGEVLNVEASAWPLEELTAK